MWYAIWDMQYNIRYTKRNVKRQLLKQRRADLPFVMLVAQANGYMCWFTLVSEFQQFKTPAARFACNFTAGKIRPPHL